MDFKKGDVLSIGCDHGGFELKNAIIAHMNERGIEVKDLGTFDGSAVDYPEIALKVTASVTSGESKRGILVCGTGIGMSIAANKHKGIRAACCSDTFSARLTREHNDANVLCFGERVVGIGLALDLVDAFIGAEYLNNGNHVTRVAMLKEIEDGTFGK